MEENMLKTSFSYTDEFGQISILEKTFTQDTLEITNTFDFLLEEFRCFLLASGFSSCNVDKIQYIDDEED